MSDSALLAISDRLADLAAAAAPSVVQVQGRRRPVSGIVFADDAVLTTARAMGRDGGVQVRTSDQRTIEATLAGWDSATDLVVLRVPGLGVAPLRRSDRPARVGQLAVALARSWSNALTASSGIVSVIGGPLPIRRGRALEEVIRTTAPMHDGFSGGAFLDMTGRAIGVTTAAAIRGLGVVIPASIAWRSAEALLARGSSAKRGYLGVAGQPVQLGEPQRNSADGRDTAVLVVHVAAGSPAEAAGVIVGDVVLAFDGQVIATPEDLLDALWGDRVGRSVTLRVLRGGRALDLAVTAGERPSHS
jgi:S1-C subfamily serine protease